MCRSQYPPIRLLDTATYNWKKRFDPLLNYTVPKIISDVIGGGPNGAANLTEPEGGWLFTELQSIMALNVTQSGSPSKENTSSSAAPSSTTGSASTPTSPTPRPSKGKATDLITGGIVGGVVALALFVGGFIYHRRWRSRRALRTSQPAENEAAWMRKELPATESVRHEAAGTHTSELEASSRSELAGVYSTAHELPASNSG